MRRLLPCLLVLISAMVAAVPVFAQAPPPVPPLPDTERRTTYAITTQTGPFDVGFAVYGDGTDYGNWLEVYLDGVLLTPISQWTLTLASGTLSSAARPLTNARVILTAASTGSLQIVGARRPRRTAQFAENQGVSARSLNQAITDLVAQNREVWDKVNDVTGRSIFGRPGEAWAQLPKSSSRAGKVLCFDGLGVPTVCDAGGSGGGGGGGTDILPLNNVWTGANTWTPPSFTLSRAINTQQAGAGSVPATGAALNAIAIGPEVIDAGANFVDGLSLIHSFGGPGTKGGREALNVVLSMDGTPDPGGSNNFAVAGVFRSQAQASNPLGQIFALNLYARAQNNSTVETVNGMEINPAVTAGSSTGDKFGMSIVQTADSVVAGTREDAAIYFINQSPAVGWKSLLQIGNSTAGGVGFPIATTGTLLNVRMPGTVAIGIDFNNLTCSIACYRSPGFLVTGTGGITASGLTLPVANTGINIGLPGTVNNPFIDGNSSGFSNDFDARLIWSGGGAANGGGTITVLGTLATGQFGFKSGLISFNGLTSGAVNVTVAPAAGSFDFILPITAGTAGQCLVSGGGTLAMTWGACSGGGGGSGTVTSVATSAPISGGTFTTSGTISCPTCVTSAASLTANQLVIGGGLQASSALGSLGTTTTVLHGNAAGAPTFGAVVSADLNITTTSCTNQFVTAISSGGVGTCSTDTLASAQHANQGTSTTVLHGNAAGNPSWGAVSLTADISGTLPAANGGTGITSLGTGVATALGINVGTAGAVVVNGGAIGTATGTSLALGGCTLGSNVFCTTGPALITRSGTSGVGGLTIATTQTAPNAGDAGDGAFSLAYTLSAASATNELIGRIFKFDFTNNLTGGGAISNARLINFQNHSNAGTITTNLDHIYIEAGTSSGTVTNAYGLHIGTLHGTNRWGVYDESGAKSYMLGPLLLGSNTLTVNNGGIGLARTGAAASAPGALGGKIEVICGAAGTANFVAYAGTSTTPVVIATNVGAGVAGC